MSPDADADAVDVVVIDPRDETAFDEWFAILHITDLEDGSGRPGWQRAERQAPFLSEDGPEDHRCLIARRAGRAVGIADLELYRYENRHTARLEVRVLPGERRRGVGTALVKAASALTTAAGRREIGGKDMIYVTSGALDAAGPFARHLGFVVTQREVRRRLSLPLGDALSVRLREDPRCQPPGYTLLTWGDRWPDEYLDDRCELGRRMSTDAPSGDEVLDEEVWDAARVRAIEASLATQHRAKVTSVARHDGSGRLVAFSEVVVSYDAPDTAWQHDTLVLREHRGQSLGFATKVATLWSLLKRFPAVRSIDTTNAEENAHMIAINEEMGFEVVAYSNHWLKQLER